MSGEPNGKSADVGKRERSPSFPYIGLPRAIERARQLFEIARRREVRLSDAAQAWGFQPKSSSVLQTVAALLAYGLAEDEGSGEARKIRISETGRKILEDERPGVKEAAIADAALQPKFMAEMMKEWGNERPSDAICLSELKFDRGFADDAAERFLRVFDETFQFACKHAGDKLATVTSASVSEPADKPPADQKSDGVRHGGGGAGRHTNRASILMDGEREIATGLLSKDASFRLIVSGRVGEKEIDRLIKKLELDREILADPGEDDLEVGGPSSDQMHDPQ